MASTKTPKSPKRKSTPKLVNDFLILPLSLPKLPSLPESHTDATHYLYIKAHEPSQPTPSSDHSLFIANVPIDASESNIRALFADQLGGARVERVEFDSSIPATLAHKHSREDVRGQVKGDGDKTEGRESKSKKRKRDEELVAGGVVEDEESALPRVWSSELRRSGSGAVVVFVDKRSARGALKEVKKVVEDGGAVRWIGGEVVGVERYKSHLTLRYPPPSLLLSTTTAYLSQSDALHAARTRVLAQQRSVPDEDGFVMVTRGGGRTAPAARVEAAEQKKVELEERKKKNGVGSDFYRFQNRERRKEEEMRLRKGFERDRKRVVEMRQRRGKVLPEN